MVGHLRDQRRLLADDRDLVGKLGRVVRADLGPEPVLERRDDPPAVRVVLRVRRGHHEHVERQAHDVAADLDVPLLHHVEHRDLDALGEVRQLVDGDDPPVTPRDQAEVDRLGVTQRPPLGDLHRVHVADEVCDARVRRRELLDVALVAMAPRDRQVIAHGECEPLAGGRDRLVRVLPQLGAVDHRGPLVEQARQGAQDPRLALAPLAEQHDVVPGDERALELRHDRVLEAVQAGPGIVALAEGRKEIGADLDPHRRVDVAGGAKLADRCCSWTVHHDERTSGRGGCTRCERDQAPLRLRSLSRACIKGGGDGRGLRGRQGATWRRSATSARETFRRHLPVRDARAGRVRASSRSSSSCCWSSACCRRSSSESSDI